jgi:hypothetical protein
LGTTVIAKSLETPDRSSIFLDKSHRESVVLSTVTIGRGVYQPGWRWSSHVGPLAGKPSEPHVGYIVSGRLMLRGRDGVTVEVGPGDAFEASAGHDAWVLGEEPCVALDWTSLSE